MLEVLTMVSECSAPALGLALRALKNLLSVIQIIVPILLMCAMTYHLIQLIILLSKIIFQEYILPVLRLFVGQKLSITKKGS